ncbi:hypothetical protein DTO282E5_9065 [Paecilomyces variotii]|nr:hypothetical protein DTO282E5_9065 [Paecilomyces variotii]
MGSIGVTESSPLERLNRPIAVKQPNGFAAMPLGDAMTPDSSLSKTLQTDGLNYDPVVIVGMACRLPGGVNSPDDFWEMLVNERTGRCKVPKERFNVDGFFHPEGDRSGVMNTEGGYFLQEDPRQFENSFFGINNLEATYMDPQQRKLLEVVYECFESSGATLSGIAGANIGVYVGNFTVDFQTMQARDPESLHRYSATGSCTAILSNRVSYIFDLRGPSYTLDTACSSSIYCLHNAARALISGECDGAIVAGANLITGPEQHLGTSKGGVLSPTSTCHTFDASADGYGRAEGVSALYLKKLSAAIKDGDPIRAVIRGTAINANGKTSGITQPSVSGQEEVIRKAYRMAGLTVRDTDYVECHGTGTAVGDPMEVEGLSRVFQGSDRHYPLLIGANKTNVGHSEAASGITAIIKCVLAFEKLSIPATVGLNKLNPKLHLDEWNMQIVTKATNWPSPIHRASINSFGFGGANAHAIIDSVETALPGFTAARSSKDRLEDYTKTYLLPLSASTAEALEARVKDLGASLSVHKHDFRDLCYTLANRRSNLSKKGYVLASPREAKNQLVTEGTLVTAKRPIPKYELGFIFTGQGAQWPEMGKELLKKSPIYKVTIDYLDHILQNLPDAPTWSIKSMLMEPASSSKVAEAQYSQPLCTAVQIGIVEILRTWRITPNVVVGHSSGEIAAAFAAGLISAAQAIVVAYYRGLAVSHATSEGAMLALGTGPGRASKFIEELSLGGKVVIACVNSPESVTVSGSIYGIDILHKEAERSGVFARRLQTGGKAYHSYMMAEIGDEYEQLVRKAWPSLPTVELERNRLSDGSISLFSSVGSDGPRSYSGNSTAALEADYWRKNLENSVQFNDAVQNILETGKYHLVEIGPHSALQLPIKQIRTSLKLPEEQLPYNASLVRGKDADTCLKTLAGALYLSGHELDFLGVNGIDVPESQLSVIHNLPPYHWSYTQLLWRESRLSSDLRSRRHIRHELLGSEMAAGNGIDRVWRNILKPNEIPWLEDHKLESQVVFPAAGYIAMAVEAISQIQGITESQTTRPSFTVRNVNIASALTVSLDEQQQTELFTVMAPEKISKAMMSKSWYEFSVSSMQEGTSVVHCTGNIKVSTATTCSIMSPIDTSNYEKWSMGPWYKKLAEAGLNFGPAFQSLIAMETDRARANPAALSTTILRQRVPRTTQSKFPGTYYAVHPLTIDSCLQASIMGGTAGNLDSLRAYLPVFLDHCQIAVPNPKTVDLDSSVHSISESTGFGTKTINAELKDQAGTPVISMSGVRLSLYTGQMEKGDESGETGRHPCLRVVWKPDIARLNSNTDKTSLEKYITRFLRDHPALAENVKIGVISALVDLVGHKNPNIRVLELGTGCSCKTKSWLDLLNKSTDFPRVRVWDTGVLLDNGQLSIMSNDTTKVDWEAATKAKYDVLLLPHEEKSNISLFTQKLADILNEQGVIISRDHNVSSKVLTKAKYSVFDLFSGVTFAVAPQSTGQLSGKEIVLLENLTTPSKLAIALQKHMAKLPGVTGTKYMRLNDVPENEDWGQSSIIISLLEIETPFLPTMTQEEMELLRRITDTAITLIWLSGASTLNGTSPDLTLANGLSRALMLEQPALRFVTLDIGSLSAEEDAHPTVCTQVEKTCFEEDVVGDKEFVLHDSLLHVSRFVPDPILNGLFQQREGQEVEMMTLQNATPAHLAIKRVGITDTIYFQQEAEPLTQSSLPAGYVDVDIKAVSLNAKDIYTLSGKVETRRGTTAIEFSGVIQAVAEDVIHLAPGDRVVVLAPNHFRTTERVPAWACLKMLPNERFDVMPTLPAIYSTALYALDDRAHLKAGETILVHSGAGAFGSAAIAIAQQRGAIVYTTVSTEEKKDYLVNELGVPRENIFASRDDSFVQGVLTATKGRGVDVVVNSLTGDLLHATWQCCANFGRFVEVGKRDIVDAGKLDMRVFLRNVTFTAFDLTELYYHENKFYRDILINKFGEALELYRAGKIKPVPITTFDVSEITQAYRYFSTKNRVGKVVISLENPQSVVQAVPAKYLSTFDANKSYLLVGCLGGLGRSLSRWMFIRGARHFTFLGRSGCDKPAARELVDNLRGLGAIVQVVRGDVVDREAVEAAMTACPKPVGGVIQAAMGLNEALFSRMSHKAWHTGIQPKWRGSWNLHEALEGRDDQLDFFVLTSSVSGSVGTATESNYCSANGFLDAFSRYRQNIGKPIVSIGLGMISEVGYLHENPEIEALLLRKGIQPLNESEFLQVLDLALAQHRVQEQKVPVPGLEYDRLAISHILTGLEPHGIRKLLDQGFDVNNGTMQDPRCLLLSCALQSPSKGEEQTVQSAQGAAWAQELPPAIVKGMGAEAVNMATLNEGVVHLVCKRFSNLLLLTQDKIDTAKSITSYGMDSMIAAEFRSWFYSVFKVDIPFLEVLSPSSTLQSLSDMVQQKLSEDR